MHKTLLFIGFFFVSFFSQAQKAIFTANLIDSKTNNPIEGAVFIIETTDLELISDKQGVFFSDKNVPIGEFTASITKNGYITRKFIIITKEDKKTSIRNIKMTPLTKRQKKRIPPTYKYELGTEIQGNVIDKSTSKILEDVSIAILNTKVKKNSDSEGNFSLNNKVPIGKHQLKISKERYLTQIIDVDIIGGKVGTIENLSLAPDLKDIENIIVNTFAEEELYTEYETIRNGSRYFQNSDDLFLKTATTNFSGSFFNLRGQNSSEGKVLINGVEINNVLDGEINWNAIAGTEEVSLNTDHSIGFTPSKFSFGGYNGSININSWASKFHKRTKISYQNSNRLFNHGVNATYASGLLNNGWAFAVTASKRIAAESYYEGVTYDSNSIFLSIEKRLGEKHSLGLTSIFAPTFRDKHSANTEEVFELKNDTYNAFWGNQNGTARNSRANDISAPMVILTHLWDFNEEITVQTSLSSMYSNSRNSRLDYFGATQDINGDLINLSAVNPSPTFNEKLPSFFNENSEIATNARNNFINNGQIDWGELYSTNINNNIDNAAYVLYDDITENFQVDFNTTASYIYNDNITLNATLGYVNFTSSNFAKINDLLGAKNYLDVSIFEGTNSSSQNNLNAVNIEVGEGDKFRYDYRLNASKIRALAQITYQKERLSGFAALNGVYGNYERDGLLTNGASPTNSLGSKKINMVDFGFKIGGEFRVMDNQKLYLHARYSSTSPTLDNLFYNARENNNLIENVAENTISLNAEKNIGLNFGYQFSSPKFNTHIFGYYSKVTDAMQSSFFGETSISGLQSTFIKEVLTGIDKQYVGTEISASYSFTPDLQVVGVAALGNYTFTNSPDLIYVLNESTVVDLGETSLENNHIAKGPEQLLSLGFNYKSDKKWRFSVSANYIGNTYVDVNPFRRTSTFFEDVNGNTFSSFTEEKAKELLKQQKLDDYLLVNLMAQKYWKIKDNFIGLKVGVTNLTNQKYRIGGFEAEGRTKYDKLLQDSTRKQTAFGAKLWAGYSATYFANIYFRF